MAVGADAEFAGAGREEGLSNERGRLVSGDCGGGAVVGHGRVDSNNARNVRSAHAGRGLGHVSHAGPAGHVRYDRR